LIQGFKEVDNIKLPNLIEINKVKIISNDIVNTFSLILAKKEGT